MRGGERCVVSENGEGERCVDGVVREGVLMVMREGEDRVRIGERVRGE